MSTLDVGGIHAGGAGTRGVQFDLQGALAVSRNLGLLAKTIGKFEKRAIGTLRRRVATEARRDIQREYNIKAARLSKDLSVSTPGGGLRITGYFRGIGLRNFGARQTRAGVTSAIFKGKRTLRKSAFFVGLFRGKGELANAHVARRGSPKREMTAGRYKGQIRAPLVTQYGPTASQMLRKGDRPQRLADFALGVLGAEMTRQVEAALKTTTGVTP